MPDRQIEQKDRHAKAEHKIKAHLEKIGRFYEGRLLILQFPRKKNDMHHKEEPGEELKIMDVRGQIMKLAPDGKDHKNKQGIHRDDPRDSIIKRRQKLEHLRHRALPGLIHLVETVQEQKYQQKGAHPPLEEFAVRGRVNIQMIVKIHAAGVDNRREQNRKNDLRKKNHPFTHSNNPFLQS